MKHIKEIHSSNLSRIMTCAGVLQFDLPKQEAGDAAKEGTAAGEYLEHLIAKNPNIADSAKNGVRFDEDIKFYMNHVYQDLTTRAQSEILAEVKVDWKTRSGIWIKGRYDASYVKDGKLCIDDLKYGYGIVEVKENWQLISYAIGEVIRRGVAFEKIVLRILQPRPHHEDGSYREWEISYEQLLEYKEQIEQRMSQIANGFAELVTSPKCKYCPASASACTAFNRAFYSGIDFIISDFKQDELNENEISHQLELIERVEDVLKIKKDSIRELAISKIKEGKIIPKYTTEQSFGDRTWKSEISPEVIKMMTGVEVTKNVMLSPAQCEKIGVDKKLVANFVDRKFTGVKLVKKDVTKIAEQAFGKIGG